jgi:very-short-patch-repair endonuclease
MKFLYNNPELKDRRKALRKDQTDTERIVWSVLRNKQCNGLKFFRQFSVGPYILDFYCPKKRLAIEIDGGQHAKADRQEYDEIRTQYLLQNNIIELRFWNNEVLENLEGVYDRILEICK